MISTTLTDPPRPAELLDRGSEWERLAAAWQSERPELVIALGRRRVGKSYLLTRFSAAVGGIYYQATERTESEQLARLSQQVGERFEDPVLVQVPFRDWESLLRYVTVRAGGAPFLVVLDEFPYLAEAAPALPSILQLLWDHDWPGTRIRLVLSGSHITAMRGLEASDRPLYGRRTARLVVPAFGYREAALFQPRASARERLRTYAVYGGLPGHLALLEPDETLGTNVAAHMLDPSGRLADEAQHMLDAFLGEAAVHNTIVSAIANGAQTWSGITSRVGKTSGSLSRPMRWLTEMQVVARVVPVTEREAQKSKRALYRLVDPYVAFWHRFVAPLVHSGVLGLLPPERLWQGVEERLDDWMGPLFERVCRTFAFAAGALPFEVIRVGEWWDARSENQIDVVALGAAGDLLLGECKWGRAAAGDVATLRRRADLILHELSGIRRVHFALFTGADTAADVRAQIEAGTLLHYTLDDLYVSR